uniref:RAWUL domain-containing protein n=1 Tax=Anopheles coluzzii TaxID=1518534 RepID=A0A8W7PG31_ANOCL
LAEHNASSAQLPITYLQCPAAVTVHHLYKFILTKNGVQVGSDNVRVEIIYEEEILPHDFTLMDVAYCFDYKRVSDRLECCSLLQCLYFVPETASFSRATSLIHSVQKGNKFHTLSDVLVMGRKQFVRCLFWKTVIEFHLREYTVKKVSFQEFIFFSLKEFQVVRSILIVSSAH